MILHTDFRDYYDHAIGFGVDEKVHYNRFTKGVPIVLKTQNDWPPHRNAGLIGFCGSIFPYVKLHRKDKRYSYPGEEWPKVVEICFAYNYDTYKEKELEWKDFSNDFAYWDRVRDTKLKQFFANWALQNDNIFLEHRVPTWALNFNSGRELNGLLNPRLGNYHFERIRDANNAFQEISMYLANILVEQKDVAVIEDKYRIQQHGFDLKDSFRNQKNRRGS